MGSAFHKQPAFEEWIEWANSDGQHAHFLTRDLLLGTLGNPIRGKESVEAQEVRNCQGCGAPMKGFGCSYCGRGE